MGTKGKKAACFKSVFLKKDVVFPPGIFWGSHRTRASTFLTSVRHREALYLQQNLCLCITPFPFSGAIRSDFLPTLQSFNFPPSPECFPPFFSVKKSENVTCFPTAELFYSTFILIAKWFKVCLRAVETLKGTGE